MSVGYMRLDMNSMCGQVVQLLLKAPLEVTHRQLPLALLPQQVSKCNWKRMFVYFDYAA